MDADKINAMLDRSALQNLMDNAKRLGRDDIYRLAFARKCALEGLTMDDPVEREFYTVLAAYEELLTEKNGRTTKANRTRQKMKNKGIHQCLIDWTLGSPTDGFKLLVERDMPEMTAEFLVQKYANKFPEDVVAAAKDRLQVAGVKLN